MDSSIGVTTGSCFCGSVGSSVRQEYAIVGDIVNLSARLMCASQVNILVDKPTFSMAKARYPFEALDPFKAKGKSRAQPIFKVKTLTESEKLIRKRSRYDQLP